MKLVKYYKDSCSPCAQLAVVLSSELPKYESIVVEEKNLKDYLEEAVELGVSSVPHLFLMDDNGNVLDSQRGVLGVSKFLSKHLANV